MVLLLLWLFLHPFGAHRFYLGHTGIAVAQLLVSLFTCGAGALWTFIDGIIMLINDPVDDEGCIVSSWE